MRNDKYYTYLPKAHMVALYSDEYETVEILVNYIKTNLENNTRCLYIVGDTDTNLLLRNLREVINYNEYIQSNQLIILEKENSYAQYGSFNPDSMVELLISETNKSIAEGFSGLAVTGEISWVLEYENGFEKILEYEWKIEEKVFSEHPISSICRYNLKKFTDEMIKNIIQVHPFVIWKNKAHENPYYIPIEAFKEKNLAKYQVATWLENISQFTKVKSEFKNILDKKEMALIESENKFRYVFDNSAIGKSLTLPTGEMHVNNTLCEMLGYTRSELEGTKFQEVTHPDDIELSQRVIDKLISGVVNAQNFQKRYIKSDGSTLWADIHVSLRRDSMGIPMYFMTSIIDITKRMNAEQELKQSEERFRVLFDEAPLGYQSLDINGNFIDINQQWQDTLGYIREEIIGTPFEDIVAPSYKEEFHHCFQSFKEKGVIRSEFEMLHKSGERLFIQFEGKIACDSKGKFKQTHCILQNITEQRKAQLELEANEKKYKLLYTSMSQGLALHEIITDDNGTPIDYIFLDINDSYTRLLGVTKEMSIGKRITEVMPKVEKYWIDVFGKVALTGEPMYYENYLETTGRYYATYSYSPKERQFAVLVTDITDQKKQQENLEYLSNHDYLTGLYNRKFFEEELERINKARTIPLSIIVVDINGLKVINDSFGHAKGDELLKRMAVVLKRLCKSGDIICRLGGDEFAVIMPNTGELQSEQTAIEIKRQYSEKKIQNINLSLSYGVATRTNTGVKVNELVTTAEDSMYRHKLYERESKKNNLINTIMSTLFEKSQREAHHSERVGGICYSIATEMGLSPDQVEQIRIAGLVHDIGKISIDKKILNKDGRLDDSEWEEIKKHPESGWRILSSSFEFSNLAPFILQHHERIDGSGYPNGKTGIEIPIEAKIIAVADSYDAMTSERAYKNSMTNNEAITELLRCSGTQFDSDVVNVFVNKVLQKQNC